MIKNEKAVALEYGTNAAPKVTAKGSEEVALAIIEERGRKVHIAKDPQLVAVLSQLSLKKKSLKSYTQQLLLYYLGSLAKRNNPWREQLIGAISLCIAHFISKFTASIFLIYRKFLR